MQCKNVIKIIKTTWTLIRVNFHKSLRGAHGRNMKLFIRKDHHKIVTWEIEKSRINMSRIWMQIHLDNDCVTKGLRREARVGSSLWSNDKFILVHSIVKNCFTIAANFGNFVTSQDFTKNIWEQIKWRRIKKEKKNIPELCPPVVKDSWSWCISLDSWPHIFVKHRPICLHICIMSVKCARFPFLSRGCWEYLRDWQKKNEWVRPEMVGKEICFGVRIVEMENFLK